MKNIVWIVLKFLGLGISEIL